MEIIFPNTKVLTSSQIGAIGLLPNPKKLSYEYWSSYLAYFKQKPALGWQVRLSDRLNWANK